MLRVLMTSAPGVGHVGPMLSLGRALLGAGHDVRIATHPERHGLILDAGLSPLAAGMAAAEMEAERPRRWPDTEGRPNAEWVFRMFARIMAPTMRRDVLAATADWRPQVLIHEEGEYAGPVVATELDIPWITHGWGSPLRPLEDLVRLEIDAAPLWQQAGLKVPPAAGLYAHGVVDPCPRFLQDTRPGVTRAWALRPEVLDTPSTPAATEGFPDGPLAYVGFGTVPRFADALDEVSAAVGACITNGLATVVTTSNERMRTQLESFHADHVAVRPFVSLASLLPRCRVVVSHGGAGTALAALAAAVPLVLVPRGAPSQVRMAAACDTAGVAIVVAPDSLETLRDAVTTALDDAHTQQAVLAAEQIRAMPSAQEVVAALEASLL